MGDSNPVPHGCEDDLLARDDCGMAKVHNRDHIAVLRGRFTLLPPLPLSRNRSNSSFFLFPGVTSFPQSRALFSRRSLDTNTIVPTSYTSFPGVDSFPWNWTNTRSTCLFLLLPSLLKGRANSSFFSLGSFLFYSTRPRAISSFSKKTPLNRPEPLPREDHSFNTL